MKNILVLILAVAPFAAPLWAQNAQIMDDVSRVVLNTYVSEDEAVVPAYAQSYLANKLGQITSNNGMGGGNSTNGRFYLTAKVLLVGSEVQPTSPPMYAVNMDLTLYIVDAVEKTVFSSTNLSLKGAGNTETKASISALKNVKSDNPQIVSFLDKGKAKVIDYFNTNCDIILAQATTFANRNEFGPAFYQLSGIPSVSRECFDRSLKVSEEIFAVFTEFDCKTRLNQAKQVWNAGLDVEAAQQAGAILAGINPNAGCFGQAEALANEIKTRITKLDSREWDLFYKKEFDLEKARIAAYRDVGVAWGNGQPSTVTTNVFGGWPW